jgi:ribosomal protein L14E/L6E/L27E
MAYLNYDIGPDVLNRIKGAYAPIDKNIGKIGDDLSKRAKEYSDEKYKQWKEEEEKKRLAEARADAKKVVDPSKDPYEKTDISDIDVTDAEEVLDEDGANIGGYKASYDWDTSFSEPSIPSMPSGSAFQKHKEGHDEGPDDGPHERPKRMFGYGFEQAEDRGAIASSNLYKQFTVLIKNLKDNKFMPGDKEQRLIAAKDMGEISASLKMWMSSIQDAKEVWEGVGFSKALRPFEMAVLDMTASQDNVIASLDEKNQLIMNLPMPDGSVIPISRPDYDRIIEKRIRPAAIEKEWAESLITFEKMGVEGRTWNNDIMLKQNLNNITPENIDKFFLDPIFGPRSMAEDYQSSPKLRGLEGVDMVKILDAAEDDENIYNELREDVAEYMTMLQKQAYDAGSAKSESTASTTQSKNTEGLTPAQKLSYYRNLVK